MPHTPGEWELQEDNGDYRIVSNEQYSPILVATVYATAHEDDIGDGESNARLVKAAPGLLAALATIRDIGEGSTSANSLPNIARLAREAIAKAKGVRDAIQKTLEDRS